MSSGSLPLGKVIRSLREEIIEAALTAKNESIQFTLGPIEIELALTATTEGGTDGKIKFEVLGVGADIGGEGKISREHVQKVKFTLTPQDTIVLKNNTTSSSTLIIPKEERA